MGFHHVALATRDLAATHRFYTEAMGFELVKVVAAPTPDHTGWSKHVFYDTGGAGMIAFWELHDPTIGEDFPTDLNRSVGLPAWVNHLAFDAPSRDHLDQRRRRWQELGITVLEVDHEFCVSIYTTDPNGVLVEFCHTVRDFTPAEKQAAQEMLLADGDGVTLEDDPPIVVHRPVTPASS